MLNFLFIKWKNKEAIVTGTFEKCLSQFKGKGFKMDNPIKVLIVDDESGLADGIKDLLELREYKAFAAVEADAAMDIFERERPEICVLDVRLDDSSMNGVDILEKIKSAAPNTECIMFSCYNDDEPIKRAKELGAADFVAKPYDPREFFKKIGKLADKIRAGEASNG